MAEAPPDLPAWFSPIDLDAEERRQQIIAIRRRRFIGPSGLVARFERGGDPLYTLQDVIDLIGGPELPPTEIARQFLVDVRTGAFPDGFKDCGPDRRAVRSLLDLHNFKIPMEGEYSLRPGFAPAQYVLRPSVSTVGEAPDVMRTCRTVWRRWLEARGWPVPASWLFVFTPAPAMNYRENFRRYFRLLSAVEQARASANGIVTRYLNVLGFPGSSSELRQVVAEEREQRGLR